MSYTPADELGVRLLMLNTGLSHEDARVMWAAPDLLEACKLALKLPRPWMDGGITWPEWDSACATIEAALAKAERS